MLEPPPRARTDPLAHADRSRAPALVLTVVVLLEVGYVLLFSPFVTTDGSAHIGSAAALVDSITGFELGSRYLEWNPWPVPNLLANLLLAALLPVVGAEWAERLVVVGYVIALPLATLYAVRAMRPGSDWLACFAIPLTFSLCLLWGFLNFSYSIVAFLVTAGFLLRTPARMTRGRTAGLAALLLLAFFSHLVGYAVACLFVVIVLAMRGIFHSELRANIAGHGIAALAPSAVLAAAYVASSDSAQGMQWSYSLLRKLAGTVSLTWGVVTYDRLEIVLCAAAALALAFLVLAACVRLRPWRERAPDTLAAGLFTLVVAFVAVVAPDDVASGGSFISHRLALFPVFGALIWLAGQRLPRSFLVASATVALAVAAGLALVRYDDLRQAERIAHDLTPTIDCVAPERTIVQGNLARPRFGSAERIDLFTDETGRVAAGTDGLALGDVDLRAPQWVQRFRPDTSPTEHLFFPGAFVPDVPPPLDLPGFERATGKPVDYVLLWARAEMSEETRRSGSWRRFDRSLRNRYRLAVRSPDGWWELWVSRTHPVHREAVCEQGDDVQARA